MTRDFRLLPLRHMIGVVPKAAVRSRVPDIAVPMDQEILHAVLD